MPDRAQWEADTQAACNGAITALNGQASNPTGLAVCYNLPFLNNQTGVFIAELRLYKVTDPIAPWTGVNVRDINMALSYPGAAVQNVQGSLNKRDLLEARQNANDVTPEQLKVLMYVGRINSNAMGTAMAQYASPFPSPDSPSLPRRILTPHRAEIQRLLIPQIELSANSPSGQPLTAALSSSDASFLNGVFATTGTVNTDDPAAAASATAAAQAAQPFELPGTRLAFFPVGLVITSVWTAIFFLAVGLGTFGRLQFREQYRRRIKREMANGVRTI
jgi:hypothetical protein